MGAGVTKQTGIMLVHGSARSRGAVVGEFFSCGLMIDGSGRSAGWFDTRMNKDFYFSERISIQRRTR
jgi:hypothetical protein